MITLLKEIYHKYADFFLIRLVSDIYRNGFPLMNFMAFLKVRKIAKKKKEDRKIRVAFLCQYPQGWNKQRSIYEAMLKDERFKAYLIAVPDDMSNITDDVYNFLYELYGENVINSFYDGTWYELEEIEPDYVFLQRPYDQYMPPKYRSDILAKYAKVCYVNYGYELTVPMLKICLSKKFLRNIYCFFAENYLVQEFNVNRFKYSHKQGYRKTVDIGYPALEDFMERGKEHKDKVNKKPVVLWTPRWTEEKRLGGSTFMKYKDEAVKYFKDQAESKLVFRPHPMTFSHMVSIGKMTQRDVDIYLKQYENDERLEYDTSKDYTEKFWSSDILLTDISSIIVEYFITGKPIIYCETGAEINDFSKEMISALYVVNSWEEIENTLNMLVNGEDPLREKRKEKIEQLFSSGFENISLRYLDELYMDFKEIK